MEREICGYIITKGADAGDTCQLTTGHKSRTHRGPRYRARQLTWQMQYNAKRYKDGKAWSQQPENRDAMRYHTWRHYHLSVKGLQSSVRKNAKRRGNR